MKIRNAVAGRCAAWMIAAASMGLAGAPTLAQESIPQPQPQAPSVEESAQDRAVAERVRDTLLGDLAMEGIQLLVSVANGTVELLGVARDRAQAERAVQLAREVPGVIDVVHYIEVNGVRPTGNTV
ncbi:MAG: BON domain-containing protein [Burkholderiales bacterium]